MLTVISTILVFGFLIFIHEFGHYITARMFKITIEEFSIGMGPRLFSRVSKKTGIRYTVALLPIGGFVSMPGENGEYNGDANNPEADKYKDDPNTFGKKPAWQRFIVTAAGACVNIITGFLIMIVLTCMIKIGGTTINYYPDSPQVQSSEKLQIGDEILEIEGKRVEFADEVTYEIMRKGNEPIDILVLRDGNEVFLEDVSFPVADMEGQTFGQRDFGIAVIEDKGFGTVMQYSFRKSVLTIRMCWESLYDLITGRYTFAAVTGPVGMSESIGTAARDSFASLLNIVVLISINLGVMNLLPIPALDGGRIFTLLIEMVTRKKLPAKVESMINMIGLCALLGLSFIVLIKDVINLI